MTRNPHQHLNVHNTMNTSKGVYVWTIDGAMQGHYRTAKEAGEAIGLGKSNRILHCIDKGVVSHGKWVFTRQPIFKKKRILPPEPVWVWNLDGSLYMKFETTADAAKHMSVVQDSVRDAIRDGWKLKRKYIATRSDSFTPPKPRKPARAAP